MRSTKLLTTTAGVVLGTALITGVATGHASACSPDEQGDNQDGHMGHATSAGAWDNDMHMQQLHSQLDASLREHAAVGVEALKAAYLKTPDAPALMQSVEMNNMAIADTVNALYPGTHDEFLELWRAHIGYYQQYLNATVAGDAAGRDQAKDNLAQFASDMADLLGDSQDNLDTDSLEDALNMHGEQVLSIIDDFAAGNYDQAYTTAHEAYEHMGSTADLLAAGARGHHDYTMNM
jgi:hypothetical protein